MFDLDGMINELARQRPVFHSEADFQHAFAWVLHQHLPGAKIRLEFPLECKGSTLRVDIWVQEGWGALALELKYKTRKLQACICDEHFVLADQSAQDHGRYDFIKDIQRLEQIVFSYPHTAGCAVLLTNDSSYWTAKASSHSSVDADFHLHQGRVLHGTLRWGATASMGTLRGRELPLKLEGTYRTCWRDYSDLGVTGDGVFRYLAIRVDALTTPHHS